MTDLGTLGGSNQDSDAIGINDLSKIVGYAYTASNAKHAFLWQNNLMTDVGDPASYSIANAISPHGNYIVGLDANGSFLASPSLAVGGTSGAAGVLDFDLSDLLPYLDSSDPTRPPLSQITKVQLNLSYFGASYQVGNVLQVYAEQAEGANSISSADGSAVSSLVGT